MRPNSAGRRNRNRGNNNRKNTPNRSQVFDSNGPDVRIRGTAFQVQEKYMALAKDASSGGDHVLAESYLQHAEHYQRLINTWNEEDAARQQQQQANQSQPQQEQPQQPQEQDEDDKPQAKKTTRGRKKYNNNDNNDDLDLPGSILTPTDDYKQGKKEMADA